MLFNKALKTLFHLLLFALPGHTVVTGYHIFILQIQHTSYNSVGIQTHTMNSTQHLQDNH